MEAVNHAGGRSGADGDASCGAGSSSNSGSAGIFVSVFGSGADDVLWDGTIVVASETAVVPVELSLKE